MGDQALYPYHASDELAEALREFKKASQAFTAEYIDPWNEAHPKHRLLWKQRNLTADQEAVGFEDGDDDAPEGLSRARTRVQLIPRKTKAGREWQAVLDKVNEIPLVADVFRRFSVPTEVWKGLRITPTQWFEAGEDGVIVANLADMSAESGAMKHLTPMKLSEFYSIKERIEAKADA